MNVHLLSVDIAQKTVVGDVSLFIGHLRSYSVC